MDRAEWVAFLREGTRTGKLGVVRADGAPHVVPIWFVVDDSAPTVRLRFTTARSGIKANAIRRDPRVVVLVDEEVAPFAFVKVAGPAELSDDLDEMLEVATACGSRYMGAERADEYGRRNAVPEEVLVTISAERVVARRGIAD